MHRHTRTRILQRNKHAPVTVCLAIRLAVHRNLRADGLLVRLDVELDEETQVAREQQAAKDRCALRSGARTQGGEVREVVGRVVRVRYDSRLSNGRARLNQRDSLAK